MEQLCSKQNDCVANILASSGQYNTNGVCINLLRSYGFVIFDSVTAKLFRSVSIRGL